MKFLTILIVISFLSLQNLLSIEVIVKKDNNEAKNINYASSRIGWEESVVLQPDGPCNVNKIQIYYSGNQKCKDTLWIVGFPTAGNLYPTEYIWDYNSLIDPVVVDYDGVPGWKEYDIKGKGLRSDGYDKIVIQHKFKPIGPYFNYDSDAMQGFSWFTDPFTPNGNFYGIMGTIHYMSSGDYMVRLVVEYDYPMENTSSKPPAPTINATSLISGGGYPSIVDWNNDGWDDIVLGGTLFENQKNGTFKDISGANPINASGTAWGDYDNDGFIDCYALANGAADFDKRLEWNNNRMYKNLGTKLVPVDQKSVFKTPYPSTKNTFKTSVDNNKDSIHNPYNAISPVFFDYNNDGFTDLFIANRRTELGGKPEMYSPDELWENDGTGKFFNVSEKSGIRAGEPYSAYDGSNPFGYYDCYGAQAVDFNKDNLTDIFVANYRLIKDNLYMNNGSGNFSEVAAEAGVQGLPTAAPEYFGHGMGCQWGDFNNDGNPDLIVGNLAHTDYRGIFSNPSLIFQNSGAPDYLFTAVHKKVGLKFHEGNAGSIWLDLDLNGTLDLWHGKYSGGMGSFYLNQGAPDYKLIEKTWDLGCVVQNPWVAVKTDFDNDGDWDLVINGVLYRNDIIHKGKYVGIRLVGSPKDKINMDAYGTKVTVYAGGKKFFQELAGSSAGTLCSQNTNELLFGLGDVNKIDSTVIEYLNGKKNVIKTLEVNAKYKISYDGTINQKIIATPSQVWPENNQINVPDTVVLKWNRVAGAKTYISEVYFDLNQQAIYLNETKDTLSNTMILSVNKYKTFYWTVRAVYPDGSMTPKSSFWVFSLGTPSPAKIELDSPSKDNIKTSAKPIFKWHPAQFDVYLRDEIINYEIKLYDASDQILLIESSITDTFYVLKSTLSPNKKYKWQICAYLIGGEKKCSEIWSFTTMDLPSKITLTEPLDKAVDVSVKPYYKWTSNDLSTLYQLQSSLYPDFSVIDLVKDSINSTSYKQFKNQNGQTIYYWRVRGLNDGGFGAWSDVWTYKTGGVNSINDTEIKENLLNIEEINPNPAKDKISLKIYSAINDKITIFVINNIGYTIETLEKSILEGMNNLEIKLDAKYAPGMYFIKISNNKYSASKPFLLIN